MNDGSCRSLNDDRYTVGATGLALLALLQGGGETNNEETILRGIGGLVALQDPKTGRYAEPLHQRFLTDHAVATWAVCEALQSSNSGILRFSAERAVEYLLSSRNPYAAWRYAYPPTGDNDTVVTVWASLALNAARRAGVAVPNNARELGLMWVDEVSDPATGMVGYDRFGTQRTAEGRPARYDINAQFPFDAFEGPTAMGLRLRLALGQTLEEHPIARKHADLLLHKLPVWDPERYRVDVHGWSHATYAMQAAGGRHWDVWSKALRPALLESQSDEEPWSGSWDPVGVWGPFYGRHGTTAMATLALQALLDEPGSK